MSIDGRRHGAQFRKILHKTTALWTLELEHNFLSQSSPYKQQPHTDYDWYGRLNEWFNGCWFVGSNGKLKSALWVWDVLCTNSPTWENPCIAIEDETNSEIENKWQQMNKSIKNNDFMVRTHPLTLNHLITHAYTIAMAYGQCLRMIFVVVVAVHSKSIYLWICQNDRSNYERRRANNWLLVRRQDSYIRNNGRCRLTEDTR